MHFDFDNTDKPLFLQVAEQIKDGILKKIFEEGGQIPSSTEISLAYKINPATVNKGVALLSQENIVYKKRGIGMFVAEGAAEKILIRRREEFYGAFIVPLLGEAKKLGLNKEDVIKMIETDLTCSGGIK